MANQSSADQADLAAPRRHRIVPRWAVAAAISLGILTVGLVAWSLRGCAAEVNRLPWPAHDVTAREAANVDLTHLGLNVASVPDTSEGVGKGQSVDSAYVEYNYAGKKVVSIRVLEYDDSRSAFQDFGNYEAWAEQAGVTRVNFNLGSTGWVKLTFSDGRSKLLWRNDWIVEVVALEGTDRTPGDLLDAVMDALSAHWREVGSRVVRLGTGEAYST